jgi:twitching motility protein PilT
MIPPKVGSRLLTMSTINFSQVVQTMLSVSDKISDLIFSPGRPPQVELIGKLTPVQVPAWTC